MWTRVLQTISRDIKPQQGNCFMTTTMVLRTARAETHQQALQALVRSGLFGDILCAFEAFAARGVEHFGDTDIHALYHSLQIINLARAHPDCEAKIRSAATALGFCLDNSLDVCPEMGRTTGAVATTICASELLRLPRS